MNLLENYLVETHSVEECNEDWTKEEWAKNEEWLKVDATFNCWGCISREVRHYAKTRWNQIVEKGYYMG